MRNSGQRMANMAGLDLLDMLSRIDACNLVQCPSERVGHPGLRDAVRGLLPQVHGTVVLLGIEVGELYADEAEVPALKPMRWTRVGRGQRLTVIPHPSGRTRWYNDPDNRRRAGEFLRDLLRGES